jgi:hypothetical protein
MSETVFLLGGAIACGTILLMVKTIAGAFAAARGSSSEVAELREQCDHYAAMVEEVRGELATQAGQVAELQDRLDFAERLLTQARDRQALGPGREGG